MTRRNELLRCAVIVSLLGAWVATAAVAGELRGRGEWRSLSSASIQGKWEADLVREGDRVGGSMQMTGSNVFSGGTVRGTIDGGGVTLGLMANGVHQATFSGKLKDGKIEGEWECEAVKDHGVWYGTLNAAPAPREGASR